MGQALYRTYRSKKLSEVVGQEHITTALDHALKNGTISHAYLFTGPRGVGKTSVARILAHEINNLPYNEDRQHLDIIEIDAASNRRIDEIRDLRDKVHIAPSSAKYKVYIIDEVHMLTKEAFNALLKTLEEPPAHVVFILATTEAHKLPETIISRTQRFSFKPGEQQKVIDHLRHIADKEKITISDDALALIAAHGEGSFRDSVSLLDQVRNTKDAVELSDVQAVLGIAPDDIIHDILDELNTHDSVAIAKHLRAMHDQGYEAAQVAKQIGSAVRQAILQGKAVLQHDTLIQLLASLVQVPASPDPRAALEIALLDVALSGVQSQAAPALRAAASAKPAPNKVMSEEVQTPLRPSVQVAPRKAAPIKTTKPEAAAVNTRLSSSPKTAEPLEPAATPTPDISNLRTNNEDPLADADSDMLLSDDSWELILSALKQKHNTLYSMVNSARPHFEPGKITLEFSYAFHQKRLNEAHNKEIISNVIRGVTGSTMQIICIVGEGKPRAMPTTPLPPADGEIVHNAAPTQVPKSAQSPDALYIEAAEQSVQPNTVDTISDIFGDAELLES